MKILAWPIKRLALARLRSIADGDIVAPIGTELLVSTASRPVEIAHFEPAEMPERICVYGMPIRSAVREVTAESPTVLTQTPTLELRVRMFQPGEDREGVDQALGDLCSAVASALVDAPLWPTGRLWLSSYAQDAQDLAPNPEPSVTATAALVFTAEEVGYAG